MGSKVDFDEDEYGLPSDEDAQDPEDIYRLKKQQSTVQKIKNLDTEAISPVPPVPTRAPKKTEDEQR